MRRAERRVGPPRRGAARQCRGRARGEAAELAAQADTVAVSMNKGLCAPMGTILAGRTEVIELAHRTSAGSEARPCTRRGSPPRRRSSRSTRSSTGSATTTPGARARGPARRAPGPRLRPERSRRTSCWSSRRHGPRAGRVLRRLAERGVLALESDTSRIFVTHRLIGDDEVARAADAVAAVVAESRPGR